MRFRWSEYSLLRSRFGDKAGWTGLLLVFAARVVTNSATMVGFGAQLLQTRPVGGVGLDVFPEGLHLALEFGEDFGAGFAELVGLGSVEREVVEFEFDERGGADPLRVAIAHAFGVEPADHDVVVLPHGHAGEEAGVVTDGEHPASGDIASDFFALQGGEDVDAVDGAVGGEFDASGGASGGEPISAVNERGREGVGFDFVGPAHDAGDAVAALEDEAFHAAPRTGGAEAAVADGVFPLVVRFLDGDGGFGAIVAGEDDEAVFAVACFIDGVDETAEGGVELSDGAVVVFFVRCDVSFERAMDLSVGEGGLLGVGFEVVVELGEFFGRVDGGVGFVRAYEDEVGLLRVGPVFHPSDGFCDDGVAIPLPDFPHFFAIANPAVGVFGAVEGVNGGAEPMVEAVVAGVGLGLKVAEMPLADEAGVVALLLEKGGEGDFFFAEVAAFGASDGVEAGAIGSASGEDTGAGGGTDSSGGVAIGEADSFFGKGVEVRGLDDRAAVRSEVAKTEVVGEKENDVGWLGREKGSGESKGEREKKFHVS